jgi:CRP/FNR family transcriptional regulator, cyclic AMP receptor protein
MLSTTDKMIFLRRVSLFGGMALEQLRVLSAHLTEQHYLPDEVVVSEGEFSQELYIVVSGEIAIIKDHGSTHARTLNTLHGGDFFGEIAIFESAARSATAIAKSESELLMLQPEKFKQIIYQKPDMAFEIFRELSARIRRREEELSGERL